MVKLCDLVQILIPKTKVEFDIKNANNVFSFKGSLSNFIKSRQYSIYSMDEVNFSLIGSLLDGYTVKIIVEI